MRDYEKSITWLLLALAAIVVVGAFAWYMSYVSARNECDEQGGTLVKGAWVGYECVEAK